jgi:hypothetical protein
MQADTMTPSERQLFRSEASSRGIKSYRFADEDIAAVGELLPMNTVKGPAPSPGQDWAPTSLCMAQYKVVYTVVSHQPPLLVGHCVVCALKINGVHRVQLL